MALDKSAFTRVSTSVRPGAQNGLHFYSTGDATATVVAAGYSYSAEAGDYATIVKLTRALMIVPACLSLAFLMTRRRSGQSLVSVAGIFPWFILWFAAASVINTLAVLPGSVTHFLGSAGKFLIILAMSAIGLNTHIRMLLQNGVRPISLGLICWFAVATVSLAVQYFAGIL